MKNIGILVIIAVLAVAGYILISDPNTRKTEQTITSLQENIVNEIVSDNDLVNQKSNPQKLEVEPQVTVEIEANNVPDKQQIEQLKIYKVDQISFEIESLSSEFQRLKKLADDGDLESSYILGEMLQECAYQPRDIDAYNSRLTENTMTNIESLDAGYKLCKGITQEQLGLSTFYLEKVASTGNIEASLSYFRAVPLEIEGFDDSYVLDAEEASYLKTLNGKKIGYLEDTLHEGNIDSALELALSYSNTFAKTSTGYDPKKALEYLMLANFMDPSDSQGLIKPFLDSLVVETPVYIVDEARRNAKQKYINELKNKQISYFQYIGQ